MRISMDFLAIPQYHTILPTSPPPAPDLTGVFVKATGNDHHPRRGTTSQSLKIPGGMLLYMRFPWEFLVKVNLRGICDNYIMVI
jgi:hypothetical protein